MKSLLLASLLVIAGTSEARSPMRLSTRLEGAVTPFVNFKPSPKEKAKVVSVFSDGRVMGAVCDVVIESRLGVGQKSYTNCTQVEKVDQLSKREQRKMEAQIEEARDGEIRFPQMGDVHCLAMPTESFRYTAADSSVFLSAGSSPCGSVTYNQSPAAQELSDSIRSYINEYEQILETR